MTTVRYPPGTIPTALLNLLADGRCLTLGQLETELAVTRRRAADAATKLAIRGYLEQHGTGCYQLTGAGRAAAAAGEVITSGPRGPDGKPRSKRDTLRERAWRAMRVRRIFTASDLASDAAREGEQAEANIVRFLHQLRLAGFVTEIGRKKGVRFGSNGFKVYRLTRNTGPRAPIWRQDARMVRDMNTGEDIPCSTPD